MGGECALDEIAFHLVEAHLLELGGGASGLRAQTEVCRADGRARREKHTAFNCVVELANVPRPGMLMKSFAGRGAEAGNIFAIGLSVTVEKMVRQQLDMLGAGTQ